MVIRMLPKEIKKIYGEVGILKRMDGCYPNTEIAYCPLLTIPILVVSAERGLSKLKFIKSYLCLTMS